MIPHLRHFLRMSRWARNPPSEARVKLVFAIIALCVCLYLVERFIGWPDSLRINSMRF